MNIKEIFTRIKENRKYKAFFNSINPLEYMLICIPFIISFTTTKGISSSTLPFILLAISLIFSFGLLYLIGFRWRILYLIILLSISILIIFAVGQPFEFWMSSDRDEELRNCIQAILNGENPYYTRTHFGSKPSNLPFSYFLYLPVYILTGGYTYFMHLIIVILICLISFYKFSDTKSETLILPVLSFVIFSDYFFLEVGMNSDLSTLMFLFCIILFLLDEKVPNQKEILKIFKIIPEEPRKIDKKILIFSILFGSLLAARTPFWMIAPIIIFYLLKVYGLKNALMLLLLIAGCALAWILPFMLMDINFFLNVAPLAHNCKFTLWSDEELMFPLNIILNFINTYLNYGELNCTIITLLIIVVSILVGLITLRNKLHLLIIITFCFLIFLFFYAFSIYLIILSDYVCLIGIPFTFAILYSYLDDNEDTKSQEVKGINNGIDSRDNISDN